MICGKNKTKTEHREAERLFASDFPTFQFIACQTLTDASAAAAAAVSHSTFD